MVRCGTLLDHRHAAPGPPAGAGPALGATALGPVGPVARGGPVPARLFEVLKLLGFQALPVILVRGQPAARVRRDAERAEQVLRGGVSLRRLGVTEAERAIDGLPPRQVVPV